MLYSGFMEKSQRLMKQTRSGVATELYTSRGHANRTDADMRLGDADSPSALGREDDEPSPPRLRFARCTDPIEEALLEASADCRMADALFTAGD